MSSNEPDDQGRSPDCLHCHLYEPAKQFLSSHRDKSDIQLASEMIQFTAQFVAQFGLSPGDAAVALVREMHKFAVENEARRRKLS